MKKIKILCLIVFALLTAVVMTSSSRITGKTLAFSSGPPAAESGAPNETTCAVCHDSGGTPTGQFSVTAPANYNPGQTYTIIVRHTSSDNTRMRWGFQLTTLTTAGDAFVGTLTPGSELTQVISSSGNGRSYIEHTLAGSFGGSTGGAQWTFSWTAPSSNVGPIRFYAAGNQANNDGTTEGDQIYTATALSNPITATFSAHAKFDFDGDNKTDVSSFRPSSGLWSYMQSSDSAVKNVTFGLSTDKITPADYDGDGKADVSVFRPSNGTWYWLRSSDSAFAAVQFGANGDVPAPADFDGDGKADQAVFRASDGNWYINQSANGFRAEHWGSNGDIPVTADYDADGKSDIAIFRPSTGDWWLSRSSLGTTVYHFGDPADKPVPADYTGDGKADVAVWRPSNGTWYVLRSEGTGFYGAPFGLSTDIPTPGDYDGDGKADTAVFRPSTGTWYLQKSTAGFSAVQFGQNGDVPAPSAYVP
jgi:FG-GAP-like repeat